MGSTFTEHISKLTRSSYFQLRRLRAIHRSVSSNTFTSIVNAFVCSRIDYCNFLLVGLPKVRLSPLQSVLNAAARLIARLRRFSHISTFVAEQLHWLPLSVRIQFKVLILMLKSQLGVAPKYLCHQILCPTLPRQNVLSDPLTGLTFLFPVLGIQILCVHRSSSLGNGLPPSLRSTILSGSISTSFSHLKTFL